MQHQYESIERDGENLVVDHTTGLTWQQSGSKRGLRYTEAELYVRDLNNHRFAGYNDWHLPTLEEAMSLIEPKRKNGVLHINPVFDCTIALTAIA
ncbi:DUF1566 domain-containing protein [candidate division KSB1 bacterium]|nr:DUF1566 domain-containing protein [candidate division KSB1 bacterium]